MLPGLDEDLAQHPPDQLFREINEFSEIPFCLDQLESLAKITTFGALVLLRSADGLRDILEDVALQSKDFEIIQVGDEDWDKVAVSKLTPLYSCNSLLGPLGAQSDEVESDPDR